MPGSSLPLSVVNECLDDAARAGISTIRLYGGEPLLHPDLPEMIRQCLRLGLAPYVTTNGTIGGSRFDRVIEAGLRKLTFGYYGEGSVYNEYVGSRDAWARFSKGISRIRQIYGDTLQLRLNYLLSRKTCSVQQLNRAWDFALHHRLRFQVDLIHYSLPYFTEGPDRELQFTPEDAEAIRTVVGRLNRMKQERPDLYLESEASTNAIPDWLLKGPDMRVPCDANNMIWVGADGSVRLCFVTFPLGNLHQQKLREMLFSPQHYESCRKAVRLECPNCHCSRDTRIMKHLPSRLRYRASVA